MRVKAIKKGFYNGDLISEGQVFDVKDGETATWFEPLDKQKTKSEMPNSEISIGSVGTRTRARQ